MVVEAFFLKNTEHFPIGKSCCIIENYGRNFEVTVVASSNFFL
jgi:hypothetical protein